MASVREVLNKIRWSGDFDEVRIWFVHRGAPDDVKVIDGSSVSDVGRSFLQVGESMIPHHRIFRIIYRDRVVFEREPCK